MTRTIRLQTLLDIEGPDPDTNAVWQALKSYPLFDAEHPDDLLFDGDHRAELNQRIIEHYYLREIAHETGSIFVFQLRKKLREIMPQYNKLYETELLKFDPISSIGITTKRKDSTTGSSNRQSGSTSSSQGGATSRSVNSDFPQTMLDENADYASSATDVNSGSTGNNQSVGTDSSNDKQDAAGESTSTGYQGSPSDLLSKFRATILNIDMMIVDDLEECFLGYFDIGVGATGTYLDSSFYQPVPLLGRNHLYS